MRTYGELRLIEGGTAWEMSSLEPHVAIRLKHIFPRVPKQSAGPFRFPRDLMHAADLDWFLTRYLSQRDYVSSLCDHRACTPSIATRP